MRRTFFVAIALVVLLWIPAAVRAGTQGSTCNSDPSRVLLWENAIGDTSDNNDNLWECGNVNNFEGVDHSLPGGCHSQFIVFGDSWNDCISSVTIWLPTGTRYCVYQDGSYQGGYATWVGPATAYRVNMPAGFRDEVSSQRFLSASVPCDVI